MILTKKNAIRMRFVLLPHGLRHHPSHVQDLALLKDPQWVGFPHHKGAPLFITMTMGMFLVVMVLLMWKKMATGSHGSQEPLLVDDGPIYRRQDWWVEGTRYGCTSIPATRTYSGIDKHICAWGILLYKGWKGEGGIFVNKWKQWGFSTLCGTYS